MLTLKKDIIIDYPIQDVFSIFAESAKKVFQTLILIIQQKVMFLKKVINVLKLV